MAYEPIPHLDKYKLILPLNDSTPTNYAPYGNLGIRLTREGGITHTGASYKHYAASWYSDGSSDGLAITGGAFAYGTEDFTLAFWVNALTSPETYPFIMSSSLYNAGNGFIVTINGPATGWGGPGDVSFQGSTALTHRVSFGTGNASPILNSGWRHIAFVRQGVEHYCFVDGVLSQQVTATGLADYQEYQTPRLWGTTDAYTAGDFKGYLQDVISVKGAALWTSDFTPPGPLIETSSLGNIIIAPTNPIPFTLSLSLVESLSATNFSAAIVTCTAVSDTHNFRGCRVELSANYSLTTDSGYLVEWASASIDTDGFFSGASPTRITVPAGVSAVSVNACALIPVHSVGERTALLKYNGVEWLCGTGSLGTNVTKSTNNFSIGYVPVSAGDYFELQVYQNSGVSLDLEAGARTWLVLEVLE
jgi:hypothetical protein